MFSGWLARRCPTPCAIPASATFRSVSRKRPGTVAITVIDQGWASTLHGEGRLGAVQPQDLAELVGGSLNVDSAPVRHRGEDHPARMTPALIESAIRSTKPLTLDSATRCISMRSSARPTAPIGGVYEPRNES